MAASELLTGGLVMKTWPEVIEAAKQNSAMTERVNAVVSAARTVLEKPLIRRAYTFNDVQEPDERCANIRNPEQREIFGLAMSDNRAVSRVYHDMIPCATAFRLTGDAVFADRVREQLEEVSAWSPVQRGGWMLFDNAVEVPDNWKDNPRWGGSWLATGRGIQAITDTLEIMPAEEIPSELKDRIDRQLETETEQITEDWHLKRQWFVKSDNALTNQWVLPTQGLILACLHLGCGRHKKAYELGVQNILKTLDAQNADGSYAEGWVYAANCTLPSLLSIGRSMALYGDSRVLDHSFTQRFPRWLVHQFQPGRQFVNAFDATIAVRGRYAELAPEFCRIAACTQDRDALWVLRYQIQEVTADPWGLAAAQLPDVPLEDTPPLYACYDGARSVIWRSSWQDNGDGLWLRGGHPQDQHDHRDRGHVSYTHRGRPILIECGTPTYGLMGIASHYQSGAGHNVLQIGDGPMPDPVISSREFTMPAGWQEKRIVAPVAVARLDESGGDVTMTVTGGYAGLSRWLRRIEWDSEGMTVTDTVSLEQPDVVLFRWHLGTEEVPALEGTTASWSDAVLTAVGDIPLAARLTRRQDHSLEKMIFDHEHACVIVRTREPVRDAVITTRINPVSGETGDSANTTGRKQ